MALVSSSFVPLILIGLLAGVLSGIFGIGGGIIIVPALVYVLGFSTHKAIGTSLAVLLPPVGVIAVLEYYHHDNVDLRAAVLIAGSLVIGAWLGAMASNRLGGLTLRLTFGVFVVLTGLYIIYESLEKMKR